MTTLSKLVKVIADVQGLDENQVLWIARYLREDGLITRGGRGRGGAKMTVKDAAHLLIGVNAPGSAKQSSDLVRVFYGLPLVQDFSAPEDADEWDALMSGDRFSEAFRRGSLFGDALCFLMGGEQQGNADPCETSDQIRVTLSGPFLAAHIYIGADEPERSGEVVLSARFTSSNEVTDSKGDVPDQEISRTFTKRTLKRVSEVLNE